jgi:membrane-associated phospholipid phosphatase
MSDYPALCRVLSWTYQSSLVQMAVVLIWLGFTGARVNLHRFLLVGMIASCVTMAFWTLAPSFGPAPFIDLPPDVDARIGRVVDSGYGARLLALAAGGAPPVIGQEHLMGLIAFPSMHTVMALMTTLFARGTRLFWPMVAINLLMAPAILLQGGHHLVDVIGGAALFFAVQAVVSRIVPHEKSAPAQASADSKAVPLLA